MCKKNSGITLVELLVVIAIIAVIAAIAYPVCVRVNENARKSACASNLGQLAKACMLYGQDNNFFLPPYTNMLPEDWPTWANDIANGSTSLGKPAADLLYAALYPYVKNQHIWFCPSDPYAGKNIYHWNTRHLYSSYYFSLLFSPPVSLWGNWNHSPNIQLPPEVHRRFISASNCMIIRDPNIWTKMASKPDTPPVLAGNGCEHLDGINKTFLDGHVKWYPNN